MIASPSLFAHSLPGDPDRSRWEPLAHHLRDVGHRAADFASHFGASRLALAMGLLHDIGKCSDAYQRYITTPGSNRGPDHSSAGAREAVARFGPRQGRVIAYAIAAHHAGLMDGSGNGYRGSALDRRLNDLDYAIEPYPRWRDQIPDLPEPRDLSHDRPPSLDPQTQGFGVAFFTRMLFSCLVDADFLETERFYASIDGRAMPARGGVVGQEHLERVRAYMDQRIVRDTPLNRLRAEILAHAVAKAPARPGFFTLTVPTGGGKTLTSLRFALEHAVANGLRRIVYVIPYTSIIEQTAQVFREEVGLGDAVLEHHSSFDWDEHGPADENDCEGEGAAGRAKLRRDAENWDAPIVVTTGVQFWESLFAARPGRARKLHNLANSVIVLDEAQMVPLHLLRPCMAAIGELVRNYGATVILCTATQPALRKIDGALPPHKGKHRDVAQGLAIDEERELAPRPRKLYRELKRVEVEWRRDSVPDAEIAARFADRDGMLCIVNSRRHAGELFEAIRDLPGARHLTTLMCARHRRAVLGDVRAALSEGRPVRLVSTSLIEAGVDVDFPEVWRAAAGLDTIAQAAGRCNREGRLDGLGRAVVFEPADHGVPPAIDAYYQAARQVFRQGADPLSLEAVHAYFTELYFQRGYEGLDQARLDGAPFPIMPALESGVKSLSFPFSQIASAFRLIDETMEPVLVPWDDAACDALDALEYADVSPAGIVRRLQQYVVPVPARIRRALLATGGAVAIRPLVYGDRFVRLPDLAQYDPALGLRIDAPDWRSAESNIVG
ncbi:CRISPR-associated endonuclease Cas3'' [Sphingomonas sp.]